MSANSNDYLDGLNPQQREAVATQEGPILILAGAGSGKTRVITYRIARLIAAHNARPENILAVTFTNKAAGEMKARVEKLLADHYGEQRPRASPLISTFHSLCVRILRRDIEKLGRGYSRSFTIYDTDDQQRLLRGCIRDCGYEDKQLTPRQTQSAISAAKNRGENPDLYAERADQMGDPRRQAIARVYALYEQRLEASNALDFDDLLIRTVQLLRNSEEARRYYHNRFRHVMVDEFQDTNGIQYSLARLIVEGDHALLHTRRPEDFWADRSFCVVGDVDQCIPKGALVLTPSGYRRVEEISKGEQIISAGGHGRTMATRVERVKAKNYSGRIIEIRTQLGKQLSVTPNHILFGKVNPWMDKHVVYLMYRQDKGYRIGHAQGGRFERTNPEALGMRVRSRQEGADKMWVLKVCETRSEAIFYESLYATKYGIPTVVFRRWGSAMALTQEQIDRFYEEIDTRERVQRLFEDFGLFTAYPHLCPKSRIDANRFIVSLVMFGDSRTSNNAPWGGHRIQFNTSDLALRHQFESAGLSCRPGNRKTWRHESSRVNYADAIGVVKTIQRLDSRIDIRHMATLVDGGKAFAEFPASHFHPGMSVAVLKNGRIVEDRVVEVRNSDYQGYIYDLDVGQLHNFICEDIVCHNSIYGWRGSDFNLILHFELDFPGTKVVKLEDNYRSTGRILAAANKVIANNTQRFDKVLRANAAEGEKIRYAQLLDGETEARWVAGKIEEHLRREPGIRAAVLYRTNAQSRLFEESCRRAGLRYNLVGGFSFYERAEIKDIIAYLKLALNPKDSIALMRVINTPPRGIGKTTLDDIERRAKDFGVSQWETISIVVEQNLLPARAVSALKSFSDVVTGLAERSRDPAEPISEIVKAAVIDSGYERALKDENTEEAEGRLLNLEELVNAAAESEQRGETLRDFLDHAALVSDTDEYKAEAQITLMTMHAAKGLEFPLVFIAGLEEGLFPHSRANESQNDLEEERRLCYVAITRAEKYLYLTHSMKRRVYGAETPSEPSRFLMEFPLELIEDQSKGGSWLRFANRSSAFEGPEPAPTPARAGRRTGNYQGRTYNDAESVKEFFARQGRNIDSADFETRAGSDGESGGRGATGQAGLKVGTRVRHAKYGVGLIVKREGEDENAKLTINFPGYGHKKMIEKYAALEKA